MSLSGVMSYAKNTSNIEERYRDKQSKIEDLSKMAMDTIEVTDKMESIPWSKASLDKNETIDFWQRQGFTYNEDLDSFDFIGDNSFTVDRSIMKNLKENFVLGNVSVDDIKRMQEMYTTPIKKFEGGIGIKKYKHGIGLTPNLEFTTEGEDEILTTIKGEPALITQAEKNLKDLAGPVGEEIIAATGSGEEIGGIKKYQDGIGIKTNYGPGSGFSLLGNNNMSMSSLNSGVGFKPKGNSLMEVGQNALMNVSPGFGLATIAVKELLDANNMAKMNVEKINQLEKGIGAMGSKISQAQEDFSNFKQDALKNVSQTFQGMSSKASSSIDSLKNTIEGAMKKSNLTTGSTEQIKDNFAKTMSENVSLTSKNVFDDYESSLDDAGRKTQDTIEDIGLAIEDAKYKVNTLKKSDHWSENFAGGLLGFLDR